MKMRRILASALALAVCACSSQLTCTDYSSQAVTAYATDEYTSVYGDVLQYNVYSDHIEIFGYNSNSTNEVTDVEIPAEIDGLPVTTICNMAFYADSAITSVTIPDSVTTIGHSAFVSCTGLTTMTIPDSVTSMSYSTFSGCSNLISVTLSDNITSLELNTFKNCSSLVSVDLPANLKTIGQGAFASTAFTEIVIPEGVTEIGKESFNGCKSLISVTIPSSVETIVGWAFGGCSALSEVNLSEGLKTIGMAAFNSCSALKTIVIPESVESVGDDAFGNIELESVTILNRDMSMAYGSFDLAENGVMYGYRNSTAQKIAESNKYTFEYLDTVLLGDVDLDGFVNSSDASLVLSAYAVVATGGESPLEDIQKSAGDVNYDGAIDSSDASSILAYYAYIATGGEGLLEDFLG